MTRDPFEELFGPAGEEPRPVPARDRLAYEQAERVRTAQLETKPESTNRIAKFRPWIIVGVVAVLALVGSIVMVNLARGGGDTTATPAPTTTQPTTENSPSTPATTEPTETDDPTPDPDEVPAVEVGPTNNMPIGPWNATSELSQKLGSTSFSIPDGSNLVLSSALLDSFPNECADMRTAWGATLLENGTYEVRKPATRCAAAPELYDEVWGLVAAWVTTIKPA
ncbi:hypothetical protein MUN76_14090 [Leucobacter rhizosphaerae]|uniref:Serine/threonine protein kinase n=1 Tax=Leucobacter rhizosphaerae TaxID=2932245 RepID=A0ABY4FV94_9MICO|nr:hypothetical protein [Leucobacter rhizosphaerae]UOQ60151.1 hypothetical protein MUN76_14090 [Leucobacter rhizosphaerae]